MEALPLLESTTQSQGEALSMAETVFVSSAILPARASRRRTDSMTDWTILEKSRSALMR